MNSIAPSDVIQSRFQGRDLSVYVPPWDRRVGQRRVPVVYAHDGNNLFDPRQAFLGRHWKVQESLDRLILGGLIPPVALVGIHNTSNRISEYTPVRCKNEGGGRGREYIRFIVDELIPWAVWQFPISNACEDTTMMGSSLGGLISLYATFWYPDRVGMAGVLSPSVKWAESHLLRRFLPSQHRKNHRLWIDIGLLETDPRELESVQHTRELVSCLLRMGYRSLKDLGYVEQADAGHDEDAWSERFPWMMAFLYGRHRGWRFSGAWRE